VSKDGDIKEIWAIFFMLTVNMHEVMRRKMFTGGFLLTSNSGLNGNKPSNIGNKPSNGSVSKPCTPGEHQNSW